MASGMFFTPDLSWTPNDVIVEQLDVRHLTSAEKYVVVLYNILTSQECSQIIEDTETKYSYDPALVNIGGGRQKYIGDVRNNDRCIIDSPVTMEFLWQRIVTTLPKDMRFTKKNFSAVGLNERMRVLRYDRGHFFASHYDGNYIRGGEAGEERRGEISFVTCQLYLNEGFEGGATRFLSERNENNGIDFIPKTGSVLLFQHDILHEGSMLLSGRKYALRTDVMFTDSGPGREYSNRPIELK